LNGSFRRSCKYKGMHKKRDRCIRDQSFDGSRIARPIVHLNQVKLFSFYDFKHSMQIALPVSRSYSDNRQISALCFGFIFSMFPADHRHFMVFGDPAGDFVNTNFHRAPNWRWNGDLLWSHDTYMHVANPHPPMQIFLYPVNSVCMQKNVGYRLTYCTSAITSWLCARCANKKEARS
jgi:hypothetical protein